MYCTGWVNTGPVGVILTTMTQAFDTGKIVVKDIDDGRLDTNKPGRETINRILNNKGLENILLFLDPVTLKINRVSDFLKD
jgi:adrenodoxin-NADP+ reductase